MKNYKIIIVLISIIFINSAVYANDNKILEINASGEQRVDTDTIISYSEVVIGQDYTEDLGDKILKNLFDTNLFSNIEISFTDNVLNISVKENPTINLVKFEGNKKVKDEDLLLEISLTERSVYSRSRVKKDIERMLTLYQRSGRLSTEINPTVEILDNNRVNLIYEITESNITEVSNIIILGNKVYSSAEIKSVMKTKEKRLLRLFSSASRYDPDKLEYDKQLIAQFYNDTGYPDFKILSSIAQLTPNSNSFEIIIKVNEGEFYNYGVVEVTSDLKKLNSDVIRRTIPIEDNELYDASKIKLGIKNIREIAEMEGYSFIEINPVLNQDNERNLINVNFLINEGPRVYVNEIEIVGNTRTIDRVIRREITLSEGDAYNKYAINYSKDSIRALGFFSEVEIDEVRTSFDDKIDLSVEVEEKNTGEATIGAGYSSSTSATLMFGLKESNFLGKGQRLNFSGNLSDTRNLYDISFTEPYFNNKPLSLTTKLYSNFSDPSGVNYETEELGFGLSAGFPLASNRFLSMRYELYTSKVKADSGATTYEQLLAGTDTVSAFGYTLNFDNRNSRYKPSRGYNIRLNQDLAGLGGTSYYIQNSFEFNVYKPLSERFIGALKLEAGNVNGYNEKYAPLSSNFTLGGKRLRGFKSGKVGPRSGNSYTGGQYYYLTSLETNIDLSIDPFDITTTLFVDVGSVWGLENPAYSSINDDHKMRSSMGVNFNWDSVIGPINIVYANVIDSVSTDTTDNLYFDIGYNF